jgi:hypothetical protein
LLGVDAPEEKVRLNDRKALLVPGGQSRGEGEEEE